jgi:hypothetical protein
MGLTLVVAQKLADAGLTAFYDGNPEPWRALATETHTFVRQHFPVGAKIRRDDVASALISYIEVDESLKDFLNAQKLRQAFWNRYFADLIIDRTWDEITAIPAGENNGN